MKRLILFIAFALSFLFVAPAFTTPVFAAKGCGSNSTFFGLKPWYASLETEEVDGHCEIAASNFSEDQLFTTVWAIVLTVLTDLFFLSGLGAVLMVIYSGFRYITSAGNVGAATQAKNTLVGSIVGLVIILAAHIIVNVILGFF